MSALIYTLFICNLCTFCQGFMYYINDGVYGSFNCLVFDHATVNPEVFGTDEKAEKFPSSIWGPTCDSLDCITKNVILPKVCSCFIFSTVMLPDISDASNAAK